MLNNLFAINTPKIGWAEYKNVRYLALYAWDGDNYPRSIRKLIDEQGESIYRQIVNARDPQNLLGNLLSSKYRRLLNGMIYVNPWLKDVVDINGDVIRTAAEEKAFWFKHKKLAKMMGDRLPATDIYWVLKDICILEEEQFKAVIDAAEIDFSSIEIQTLLFLGDSSKGQFPILKSVGDEVSADSVFESDTHGLRARINRLLGGLPIMVDQRDNPDNWDWFVPEIKTTEELHEEHIRGFDLEPETQPDPEREAARYLRDATYGYNWANIGWSLARSANSWHCGGPKVEASYSKTFYGLLEEEAPSTAKEFFRWLDKEWATSYIHISPDQQAMWEVIHDISEHGTNADIEREFVVFTSWLFAPDRCATYITSYKTEPMYGPRSRSYRLVGGDICGNVTLTSWEEIAYREASYDDGDDDEYKVVANDPIPNWDSDDDDFDF